MPGLEGTTLGRYRLQRRLGRGGMSEVYLAYDERMERNVAIKVVNSSYADYLERFRREAGAIGRLRHDHILPAFDFGEQGPWHYLVMPYMEHGTLRDRLAKGRLTLEEAGEMLEQIASALQAAHDQGIIHRVIKPSNILLRDEHYAYLADFGLAKTLEGASELTQTGSLLGTPEYMAPELAEGPATTGSDIYALGILLYQMVTGRVPFTAETPIAVYWKQLREQPMPPSRLNPALPHSVEQVILRALEKNPRRRYQTAQALAQAYTQALQVPAEHEVEEMPPLYDLGGKEIDMPESLADASSPAPPLSPARMQDGKLILPANPVTFPSAIKGTRVNRAASAPSPPLQAMRQTTVQEPTQPVQRPAPIRRRRRHRNPVLIAGIVGLSLLLLTILPLSFVYYNYTGQLHVAATATAYANATASVQSSNLNATQQVQANATATQQARAAATATARAQSRQQAQATATAAAVGTAHAKATQQAQAAATAGVAATVTSGTPILTDNLSSNTNGRWHESPSCVFTGGTYHVLVSQTDTLQVCGPSQSGSSSLTFDNAAIQVDVSLLSGNDAGLIFRVNGSQFYDFEITNQGQFFFRRHDSGANYTYLIPNTTSSAIASGTAKNTLLVIANGSDFKLYINGVFVGEKQDNTYSSGQIAFVTGTTGSTTSAEGSFANLKVFNV